jgi:hypothetical protein
MRLMQRTRFTFAVTLEERRQVLDWLHDTLDVEGFWTDWDLFSNPRAAKWQSSHLVYEDVARTVGRCSVNVGCQLWHQPPTFFPPSNFFLIEHQHPYFNWYMDVDFATSHHAALFKLKFG